MSFSELALEESPYSGWKLDDESRGRRLVASATSRLDESWSLLSRTTLSVACVTVAATQPDNRELARGLVLGMAGMMSRTCDYCADQVGGVTQDLLSMRECRDEYDLVDAAGKGLGKQADGFLGAIMGSLLTELPKIWSTHFSLLVESSRLLRGLLEDQDSSWVCRQVAEEQCRMMAGFIAEVEEKLADGSPQMLAALKWDEVARGVFEASVSLGSQSALAVAIKTFGFPNAEA